MSSPTRVSGTVVEPVTNHMYCHRWTEVVDDELGACGFSDSRSSQRTPPAAACFHLGQASTS